MNFFQWNKAAKKAPAIPAAKPVEQTDPSFQKAQSFWVEFSASGLFQPDWYLQSNPDLQQASVHPLRHFLESGWREGRRPNPCFDPAEYLRRYPDVAASGMNPLIHFWQYGEKENRRPVSHFDTAWYKEAYKDEIGKHSALGHFLRNRSLNKYSPNRNFDYEFYLQANPDVAAAQIDALEHYLNNGYKEGRNPSEHFDTVFYVRSFMHGDSRDPLTHYLEVGLAAGFPTRPAHGRPTQSSEIRRFSAKGPEFELPMKLPLESFTGAAKIVAFYLPQFHSFPENDRWWGTGFTEWTNVSRGTPRFEGHFQPRIPRDLGFYDLSNPKVLRTQVEVAKSAGVFGFCFYYYNFNGKRLLDAPVEQFLQSRDIAMPFCLMWANENWTRRWDGAEHELLMEQRYTAADFDQLVDDFARHFRDPRYIRLDGRPLLIVYRPDVLPDAKTALNRWRDRFESVHGEKPLIFMVQGFGNKDPNVHGFDGAIEFPPHKLAEAIPSLNSNLKFFDPAFSGSVISYDAIVERSVTEPYPSFPLIKTVVPSWDNDARRQGSGMVVHGSTPSKYQSWLTDCMKVADQNPAFGERFVFVNAWNEWAEGAYLEPDVHFGAAYLNATARAVAGLSIDHQPLKILLVGHDAHPHGAQLLLLNIGKALSRKFGIEVSFLLFGSGQLLPEYEATGATTVCSHPFELADAIGDFSKKSFSLALTNTVATGGCVQLLKQNGMRVVSLVHELPKIIQEKLLESAAEQIAGASDVVVFPANFVKSAFEKAQGQVTGKSIVRPQGLYQPISIKRSDRFLVREQYGIRDDAFVVLNVGFGDLRKGVDLFCQVARQLRNADDNVEFIWVGAIDPQIETWLIDSAASPNIRFVGSQSEVSRFFSAADLFLLTSREDPYPSVVMEAIAAKLPVVGFRDAGEFVELLEEQQNCALVPYCDTLEMTQAVRDKARGRASEDERFGTDRSSSNLFDFTEYAFWLVNQLNAKMKSVSVIVPNYNYERYVVARMSTIFDQDYPVLETIVLDDFSTDNSVKAIVEYAASRRRDLCMLTNAKNSGSVFQQWKKGLLASEGELVWIAEADDMADPKFLERMTRFFDDEELLFAFCDSIPVDADGRRLSKDYKGYYSEIFTDALSNDLIIDANEFSSKYLAVRNCILNVSAVVWRRSALQKAIEETESALSGFHLAGDWLLYITACMQKGRVGYSADTLNLHRRHSGGVTQSLKAKKHVEEVAALHALSRKLHGGSKQLVDLQGDYINQLRVQFGLDEQ